MTKRTPFGATLYLIDRVVWHIEEKAVALGIIGLSIILITNVTLRIFNSSLPATEELSQFLVFYITFLGTSYAARYGMHIRMSMLSDFLGGTPRKVLAVIIAAGTSAMMFYLSYLSYRYVMRIASLHRVSPILQIPVQYVWMIMPIGLFLTGVQYALALGRNLVSPGAWISYSQLMEGEPAASGGQDGEAAGSNKPGHKDQSLSQKPSGQED
jgi:TRAP-type C4-dicarboxylate transport system permease small subunit